MEIQQFVACKAFIGHNGKVLIIRESPKYATGSNIGRYDFPGGKVNPGEGFVQGLQREAEEECGLAIQVGRPLYVGEWKPAIKKGTVEIIGIFFECSADTDVTVPKDEYDEYRWISPEEYAKYDMVSPNPQVFETYLEMLKK